MTKRNLLETLSKKASWEGLVEIQRGTRGTLRARAYANLYGAQLMWKVPRPAPHWPQNLVQQPKKSLRQAPLHCLSWLTLMQ